MNEPTATSHITQNADWSGRNLTAACLDGMAFKNTSFAGCNLTGANTSECVFDGCDFTDSDMVDVALCESTIENCVFNGTRFAAVDLTGSTLTQCAFGSPTALHLPFAALARLNACRLTLPGQPPLALTLPPVVITGEFGRLCILDDTALLNETLTIPLTPDQCALRRDRATPSLWPLMVTSVLVDLIRESTCANADLRNAQQFF